MQLIRGCCQTPECDHQAKSVVQTTKYGHRVASSLCSANYRTSNTFQRAKQHHFKLKNKLSTNVVETCAVEEAVENGFSLAKI